MSTTTHETPRRSRGQRIRAAAAVGLVLALSGLMFAVSAKTSHGSDGRNPENLAQLVESESDRVSDLEDEVDDLDAQIETLRSARTDDDAAVGPVQSSRVAAGTVAVTGPGLRVALDDAPPGNYGEEFRADDLVVHQQDLQSVVNALWAGGAEAMSLQGQRVDATTAFRCVGNVLILKGRVYSPPFVVEAIGDTGAMKSALDRSPDIQTYLSYVDAVSLGWKVDVVKKLELPRSDSVALEHASDDGAAASDASTSEPSATDTDGDLG